jgi:chemotaxis protein methyltransferase CheR
MNDGQDGATVLDAELRAIFEQRFGHALDDRQVARLLAGLDRERARDYGALLRTLPAQSSLVQAAVRELMNKESYFFRDATTVESLREKILPELIEAASSSRVFRVWSAGCSTGEELYTVSILLQELLPELSTWQIALVGTDIDESALAQARLGRYKEWSLRTATPEQRRRYFEHVPSLGHHQLRARYRRDASFSLHNLADRNAPLPGPGCFDLILCRNVTIYFSPAAQAVLSEKLVSALARDGRWIAGPSDPRPELPLGTRVLPGVIEYRRELAARPPQPEASAVPEPWAEVPTVVLGRAPEQRPAASPRPAPALEPHKTGCTWPGVGPVATKQLDGLAEARTHADRGETENALCLLGELIAGQPLFADAYLLRAILLAPDDLRAIEDLRRVIYLDPTCVEAHLRLGFGLERRGDRRGAIRAFRNAAALSSSMNATEASLELQRIAARRMTDLLAEESHEEA